MAASAPHVALFGELLLRLAPPDRLRLVQASRLDVAYTGGEANAGAVLAACGCGARLISAVPAHAIGQACLNEMRRYGLDTRHVLRRGERLGTFFLEQGVAQRPSQVIYDRRGSSFAELRPGDLDWGGALEGCAWLHFTGTAPALSPELARLTQEGCRAARERGLTVSCDLNYRAALWTVGQARPVLRELAAACDWIVANETHARLLLGSPDLAGNGAADLFEAGRYAACLEFLRSEYGLRGAALTVRAGDLAEQTRFAAVGDDGRGPKMSRVYDITALDRVGAGDAFTGGLIAALLRGDELAEAVEFAAAAGCLKHAIAGDACHATEAEIRALVANPSAGVIKR